MWVTRTLPLEEEAWVVFPWTHYTSEGPKYLVALRDGQLLKGRCLVVWSSAAEAGSQDIQLNQLSASCAKCWCLISEKKETALSYHNSVWPPCTGSQSILKFSLKFYSKFLESLKSIAPAYLPKLLHSHTAITAVRSTDQLLLDICGSRLKQEETEPFWWQPLLCGN